MSQREGSHIISATSDYDKSSILRWRATTTDLICAEDRDFKNSLARKRSRDHGVLR